MTAMERLALRGVMNRFERQANTPPHEWVKTPADAQKQAYEDAHSRVKEFLAAAEAKP